MFFRLIEPNVINQEFYRIPLPVFRSFLAPGAAHGGIENEIERRTERIPRPIGIIGGIKVNGLHQLVIHHQLDGILVPFHDISMKIIGKILYLHSPSAGSIPFGHAVRTQVESGINHIRLLGNIFQHINLPVDGPAPFILAKQPDGRPDALGFGNLGTHFQSAEHEIFCLDRRNGTGGIGHELGILDPIRGTFLIIDIGELFKMGFQNQAAILQSHILGSACISLLGSLVTDYSQLRFPLFGVYPGTVELVTPDINPPAGEGPRRFGIFSLYRHAKACSQQHGK